jgi:hypothetical protein
MNGKQYLDRREFFKATGAGLAAAGLLRAQANPAARALTEKEKLDRIASNTWPIRDLFKTRPRAGAGGGSQQLSAMKQKYGEITMLEFPEFTKNTFPGVYRMDLFSGLFGDVTDDSMFTGYTAPAAAAPAAAAPGAAPAGGAPRVGGFDPSSASGKKWLEKLANKMAVTGTKCQHISNNAPTNISDLDPDRRKAGIEVAKKWLDGAAILGAKSMRVNSGGPQIAPAPARAADGYPKNDELATYLTNCIESFKEMADYGGKVGVKVTLENHWGLTANPINIQIIVDEVNSPYCEASPDFFNWEHEYLCYHGLAALAPYAHTTVHAKYWNRWKECDIRRCVRIMESAGFKGVYALEYEDGPWDRVEGAKYLYKEVLAAL